MRRVGKIFPTDKEAAAKAVPPAKGAGKGKEAPAKKAPVKKVADKKPAAKKSAKK